MKSYVVVLALIGVVSGAGSTPALAASVHLTASGPVLSGARMTREWTLIGFVGDFIELGDGVHRLAVKAPKNYTLQFTVRVTGQQIAVMETASRPDNCKPQLKVDWPAPVFRPHDQLKGAVSAILADPQFGAATGVTRCSHPYMMGCTTQKVILTANSEPAGAEIWISGKRQPYKTNATLSVPYCAYETEKDVLLRIPNTNNVNCGERIKLAPDAKVSLTCTLRTPGS